MQWICEAIQKHDIDTESHALLDKGHTEILQSECYEDYGVSSYIESFVQEFERTDFQSISSAQVQAALTTHKLDLKSLEGDTYLKKCSK